MVSVNANGNEINYYTASENNEPDHSLCLDLDSNRIRNAFTHSWLRMQAAVAHKTTQCKSRSMLPSSELVVAPAATCCATPRSSMGNAMELGEFVGID